MLAASWPLSALNICLLTIVWTGLRNPCSMGEVFQRSFSHHLHYICITYSLIGLGSVTSARHWVIGVFLQILNGQWALDRWIGAHVLLLSWLSSCLLCLHSFSVRGYLRGLFAKVNVSCHIGLALSAVRLNSLQSFPKLLALAKKTMLVIKGLYLSITHFLGEGTPQVTTYSPSDNNFRHMRSTINKWCEDITFTIKFNALAVGGGWRMCVPTARHWDTGLTASHSGDLYSISAGKPGASCIASVTEKFHQI